MAPITARGVPLLAITLLAGCVNPPQGQPGATYWAVFDEPSKAAFFLAGTDFRGPAGVQEALLDNPAVTKTARTIEQLERLCSFPPGRVVETVAGYNRMIDEGEDRDFHRFGRGTKGSAAKILTPPFYAMSYFPITRKSLGGVRVDLACRGLDRDRRPIPGLYAVGEITGVGGLNGKASLEGTFLGPSVFMGRVAARSILQEMGREPHLSPPASPYKEPATPSHGIAGGSADCLRCHDLERQIRTPRPGFVHFEKSHDVVLRRKTDCLACHAELAPYLPDRHRIDPLAQVMSCGACHVGRD